MASFTHEIDHNPKPEDVGTIQVRVCITKSYGLCDEELLINTPRFPVSLRDDIDVELTQILMESGEIPHMDAYAALLDFFRLVDEVTSSDEYTHDCALRVCMTLNLVFVSPEIEEEEDLSLLDALSDNILDMYYHREESDRILQIAEGIMGLLDELTLGDNSSDIGIFIEHDLEDVARSQMEELVRVSFNETNIGFRPANNLVVNSLSRKIYNKSSDIVGETDNCTICLEEYKNGGRIMTLPCGHEFDDECIVEWFKTSHICPLCRFELPCEDEGELGLGY